MGGYGARGWDKCRARGITCALQTQFFSISSIALLFSLLPEDHSSKFISMLVLVLPTWFSTVELDLSYQCLASRKKDIGK